MENDHVTIDEALLTVGEFGRGQLQQFFLVSLAWIPGAIQTLVTVFLAKDPVAHKWWKCTDPDDAACMAVLDSASPNLCDLPREAWNWTRSGRSIISEFDLICKDNWKTQAVNSAYFLGFMIGAGLFGSLSDRYGRRKALFAACLLSLFFGAATAVVPNFWYYAACRAMTGLGNAGIGVVTFVLALEPIGPSWRGFGGVTQGFSFSVGACLTALLAWSVRPWRLLVACAALPQAAFLLLWPAIHESPRWLLVAGRKGEATAALAAIAVGNRTKLPEQPLADMGNTIQVHVGLWDIIAHPRLRMRLIVMVYCWFVSSLAYYGLALGLGALSGSIYLNHVALYAIELPAYVTSGLLINRIGRRPVFIYALLECGATTLASAFTRGLLQRLLAVSGKFGIALAYNLAFIYTTELFPTSVRTTALGFCSQMGHIGGILAPVIVYLGTLAGTGMLPYLIFGSATLLGGLASGVLPETLGIIAWASVAWPNAAKEVELEASGARAAKLATFASSPR